MAMKSGSLLNVNSRKCLNIKIQYFTWQKASKLQNPLLSSSLAMSGWTSQFQGVP